MIQIVRGTSKIRHPQLKYMCIDYETLYSKHIHSPVIRHQPFLYLEGGGWNYFEKNYSKLEQKRFFLLSH